MKKASDPRHKLRKKILKELFANEFSKINKLSQTAEKIFSEKEIIDNLISKAAPEWPIEKINKVDLAVLRLATWEIRQNKNPKKVIIDEAIELAKEYGSEGSPAFVNAVLGKIING